MPIATPLLQPILENEVKEMKHKMNLWPDSFQAIEEGTKTIEMRLNDEKRKQIDKGDILEFQNTESLEKLECVVLDTIAYPSFKELYAHYDKLSIGYKEEESANYEDMYRYYSKENIKVYGALAIHICKLDSITPKILVDNGICPTCFNKENGNCLYGDNLDKLIYKDDKIECFFAGNPRADGHTIISTIKHYKDMLEAPEDVVVSVYSFAHKTMKKIKEVYHCESVYLCTMCDGPMNHFHIQLIPRYQDEERGSKNFIKPRHNYVYDKKKLMKLQGLLKEN